MGIDCENKIHKVITQYVYFFYQLMREVTLAAFPDFMGYGIVVMIQAILTWGLMWVLLIKLICKRRKIPKIQYDRISLRFSRHLHNYEQILPEK